MSQHIEHIKKTELQLKELEQKASSTYNKLARMRKSTKLSVSDHAIVRYQERVKMLPPDDVRKELLCLQVQRYYLSLGDGTYPVSDHSLRVVIKEGVIVTVIK